MRSAEQIAARDRQIILTILESPELFGRTGGEVEAVLHAHLEHWAFAVGREVELHQVFSSNIPGLGAARKFREENPAADEGDAIAFVIAKYREVAARMGIVPGGESAWPASPAPSSVQAINAPPAAKTYSVPRKFGIGAIFGVATAFGLLIWCLQMLDAPPPVIVTIAIYFAIVGGVQAIFNTAPRGASIVTGLVCTIGLFIFMAATEGAPIEVMACMFPFMLGLGLVAGYCGGAVVAGVFLVMDQLTRFLARKTASAEKSPFETDAKGE